MSTKIVGCWICYNNIQTIRHSILSIARHCDEIVVVDGSFTGETSNDGTWEVVENIKSRLSIPLAHVKSKASTLYEKHQEHVDITGNRDPNLWTWQVDSDEIYLPHHAEHIAKTIRCDTFNGLAVKLININRIENSIGYTDDSCLSLDTYQMRIYRMHKGLNFKTKDKIFEHIVYEGNVPVQRQDNKIHYFPLEQAHVYNYHCLEPFASTVKRYKHYGVTDAEVQSKKFRSVENNQRAFPDHPMRHVYRA